MIIFSHTRGGSILIKLFSDEKIGDTMIACLLSMFNVYIELYATTLF